jgi:hypothetical protein
MKPYPNRRHEQREFVSWDVEAVDWFTVTTVVALHSRGEWVAARTIRGLVNACIAKGWAGVPWWAHYGGRYDHLLALAELLPEWGLERCIYHPGFGAWTLNLRRGAVQLQLRDSMRLLPGKLADIGRAVCPVREKHAPTLAGACLCKLDVDRAHMERLTERERVRYCLRDCEVVRAGIQSLWPVLQVEGDTLASRATRALRASIPKDAWGWEPELDRECARGYYGGHTEVYRRRVDDCDAYDVNSSYPAAMAEPLPTRVLSDRASWSGGEGIVWARVTVPETAHPPLPYRPKRGAWRGVTMFPTGTWAGCWTAVELRYAIECGVTVDKVFRAAEYAVEPWMAEFMLELYAKRQSCTSPFEKYAAKILLNSCSGKLIEREEHESWSTSPPDEFDPENLDERIIRTTSGKSVAIYGTTKREPGAFRHAPSGAYVTARGRVLVHRGLVATDAAMLDTDSVYCARGRTPGNVDAQRLGAWKHEGTYRRAQFLAPKVYRLDTYDGKVIVRAKGFGLPEGWTPGRLWAAICWGDPVLRENILSFLGQLRSGLLQPRRVALSRRFHGAAPKRAPLERGESRPWTIPEILA